jgi:hypothetical protein
LASLRAHRCSSITKSSMLGIVWDSRMLEEPITLPTRFRISCNRVAPRGTMTSSTTPRGCRATTYSDSEPRRGLSGSSTLTTPGPFLNLILLSTPPRMRLRWLTTQRTFPADFPVHSLRLQTTFWRFLQAPSTRVSRHSTSPIAPQGFLVASVPFVTSTTTRWRFMEVTLGE